MLRTVDDSSANATDDDDDDEDNLPVLSDEEEGFGDTSVYDVYARYLPKEAPVVEGGGGEPTGSCGDNPCIHS